jgi:hypothetical protein
MATIFQPFDKRDIKIQYDKIPGSVVLATPQKVSGVEKVGQMCAVLILKYLNFTARILDAFPQGVYMVANTIARECEALFENDPNLPPEDNLYAVELDSVLYSPSRRMLLVRYKVITQAGIPSVVHLPLPLYESEMFKHTPNPLEEGVLVDPNTVDDWVELSEVI